MIRSKILSLRKKLFTLVLSNYIFIKIACQEAKTRQNTTYGFAPRTERCLVQSGCTFFSKTGAEELIERLVSFKNGEHNDLADVFSIFLMKIIEISIRPEPRITIF